MRGNHQAIQEQGVHVVAISPDTPSESARLTGELELPFPLLSDAHGRVAASFGLLAGDDVLPAAFLLDRRGSTRWVALGRDPTDQPSPKAALAVLSGGALPVPAPTSVLTPVVAAAVAAVFLMLGALARVANRNLLVWDAPVRDAVRDVDGGWFASLMRGASQLGSRWLIGALTIVMVAIAWRRCRQLALVLIAAFPAALGLELFLKAVVDRPRPALAGGFGSSFPSGHVLAAAAFWGLVPPWVYLVLRRRWAWAASAVLAGLVLVAVGLSRVYVGAHWPSDVLGGYFGGAMFLVTAEWAVRRPSQVLRCDACDLHPLRPAVRPGPEPHDRHHRRVGTGAE